MKQFVVTIGGEYGSGADHIGRMLAADLNIPVYDRTVVDTTGKALGLDKETIVKAEDNFGEKSQGKLPMQTRFGPRYMDLSATVIEAQFDVIIQLAIEQSCVILGRSANFILSEWDNILRVFIYAPEKDRIKSIMEREKLSEADATESVRYHDKTMHARHKYITGGMSRGDRAGRDIIIDSSLLGWEATAKLLKSIVEQKFSGEDE